MLISSRAYKDFGGGLARQNKPVVSTINSNIIAQIKKLTLHHVNVRFFTGFYSKQRVLLVPWYFF